MRFTSKLAALGLALFFSAGVAAAATSSPSGNYTGNIHWTNPGVGKQKFKVTATFAKGHLTEIKGQGDPGFIPYNPSKSNATVGCGSANTFDSGKAKISGQVDSTGHFAFTWHGQYHITVTLKGDFVSATEAKAKFRYYQSHLPAKGGATGHCDSGFLPLTLKKSS